MSLSIRLCGAVLALGLIVPGPGFAAEGGAASNRAPTPVALPPILAPIVVDGRLEGYAHITITIQPRTMDKVLTVREKVPFLQDAFLRELNKASIVKPDDHAAVDTVAVTERLTAQLNRILPAGTTSGMHFDKVVLVPVKQE